MSGETVSPVIHQFFTGFFTNFVSNFTGETVNETFSLVFHRFTGEEFPTLLTQPYAQCFALVSSGALFCGKKMLCFSTFDVIEGHGGQTRAPSTNYRVGQKSVP